MYTSGFLRIGIRQPGNEDLASGGTRSSSQIVDRTHFLVAVFPIRKKPEVYIQLVIQLCQPG